LKNSEKISLLTNDELLEAFRAGASTNYLGELYQRYIPLVYGLCLKYLANEAEAQDAVMDIYASLPEKVLKYTIDNFNAWLYSVAKNHCLQIIRKHKKINFVSVDEVHMENEVLFTLTNIARSADEAEALQHCMGTLSEEQRISIQYFFYEEKSYADIVDITGYTLMKVKSYIQNGKRNLKTCILRVLNKAE